MSLPEHRLVRRPTMSTIGVTVVLAMAGVLFATSAETARGTQLRSDRSDLPGLIRAQEARVAARLQRVTSLRSEIDQQTSMAANGSDVLTRLRQETDRLDEAGGLAPVTGRALVVTLNDAPKNTPLPDGVSPDALVVHQQDVQAVVNALWLGGAEAMMLQDQRVVSTSAVRCVGNTLNLQGRVYGPPYVITAIGDPRRLRAALKTSADIAIYLNYVKMLRLGWKVEENATVTMPAFDGAIDLRYAKAPETAAGAGDQGTRASDTGAPDTGASGDATQEGTGRTTSDDDTGAASAGAGSDGSAGEDGGSTDRSGTAP